jgi:hypothetical protein
MRTLSDLHHLNPSLWPCFCDPLLQVEAALAMPAALARLIVSFLSPEAAAAAAKRASESPASSSATEISEPSFSAG